MHTVIRAIVYATEADEALEMAKEIFNRLCCDGGPFDYFTTFDDHSSGVSGPARYGALPAVSLVESEAGKKLIDEGMDATKREFMRNVDMIRKILSVMSDDQLFEDDFFAGTKEAPKKDEEWRMPFRFYAYEVGMYRGPNVWLYDTDGEGIRTTGHLARVLAKYGDKKYEALNVYVVPADVHF